MTGSRGLIDVEAAQARVLDLVRPLEAEATGLEDAIGRALCEDVRARRTLPPWDNSAMDGYAVRAEDVSESSTRLSVVETIFAGQQPTRPLGRGEAARIMTGAPVPEGATAVVMQEKTRALEDGAAVEILERPSDRQFIRSQGEDAREGDVLLPKGTVLGIPEAALLWAQGITQVPVPRRPRVALIATGDELCRVEEEPGGRIVDTNTPALALAVRRAGGVPTILGIARDDPAEVRALLERARGFDVVLSSAGVSVGERDYVRPTLASLGAEELFAGVAIKPGKPVVFAKWDAGLYFGLPGNPASSLVTFELFVRPALRRMQGITEALPAPVPGRLEGTLKKPAGLTHFIRITATFKDGALWARPLSTQLSGVIRSTTAATHLLVFAKEAVGLGHGDPVVLLPVCWGGSQALH